MVARTLIANRTQRYGTRMLTAGEPVTFSGPDARLALALNVASEEEAAPEPEPKKKKRKARKKMAED